MRLVVKQKGGAAREFSFEEGPVSIGRAAESHVFLPDRTVSRRHALIVPESGGSWLVEDLDSASKTYVNGQAVHKAPLKDGDQIRISEFMINVLMEQKPEPVRTVDLGASPKPDDTFHMEAALATPEHETVVRNPDSNHAPAMRLAARRLNDFSIASERICSAESMDELLLTLLDATLDQFEAYHVWCAIRSTPDGPMTCHGGKKSDGNSIDLNSLPLREKIAQAVEKGEYLVLPRVSAKLESEAIRSAMIATILRPEGCFGVLYVDNSMKAKHYSLSDLDYLMLLAMHTAASMRNLLIKS